LSNKTDFDADALSYKNIQETSINNDFNIREV